MKHLETRQIIRELAKKYNVPIYQIENVVSTIPDFIMSTTREEVNKLEGKYPIFRVPEWGIFYVPEQVIEHVKTKLQNKINNGIISMDKL